MAKHKSDRTTQFAALPWRISEHGTRQVLLLTSRETRRWVIPKGWPMKKRRPAEVASQEAYEEAGLIGRILGKRPIGNFHYMKRLAKGEVLCQVRVFLFRVEQQLDLGSRSLDRRAGFPRFFHGLHGADSGRVSMWRRGRRPARRSTGSSWVLINRAFSAYSRGCRRFSCAEQ